MMDIKEARKLATHLHWKGGLYRFFRVEREYDYMIEKWISVAVYEHLWPHERKMWRRPLSEFNDIHPNGQKRFVDLRNGTEASSDHSHS